MAAKTEFLLLHCFFVIFLLSLSIFWCAADEDRKEYIIYMGALPGGEYIPSSHHKSILQEIVDGRSVESVLDRSYERSFNGFVAILTDHEIEKLAKMKEVVSVIPSETLKLHTTRSWDFMGFEETAPRMQRVESDIVVGVIDGGIWLDLESFNDQGFGPAPKKWKGVCEGGSNFTCNKKVIGARYYTGQNVIDVDGHGTHTASTVAGNKVAGVSFFDLGQGSARGGVPSARISAYKVCAPSACFNKHTLSAFDDAIADGVDIITISLGPEVPPRQFFQDTIAIGAFHAMEKGILTMQSAGNDGPRAGTVSSIAPWVMSIAASTIDRLFVDKVVLGNGKTLVGYSVNAFSPKGKSPLIHGFPYASPECLSESLNASLVKGKILVCDKSNGFIEASKAGAAGSIVKKIVDDKDSRLVSLPALALVSDSHNSLLAYMNTTKDPEGEILKTEMVRDSTAPMVPYFSSRGPNILVPDILKPDVSAPGVDILAAFSPIAQVNEEDPGDQRRVRYNILSGTSMACPHAAGVAAYVKSFHPDWSPSAIKSAIMTTAWPMYASSSAQAEFAYGSGHINPIKAVNPGLVYETFRQDYIQLLCSIGYDETKLRNITEGNITCPVSSNQASAKDLNYPSMAAQVSPGKSFTIEFPRTVTNVGFPNSTYKAKTLKNPKIRIKVVPKALCFKSLNEKKTFRVTVKGKYLGEGDIVSAALVWSDGNHRVRSPIVIFSSGEKF